jgi:membrane protease YdiL (CAAX protease family)
MSGADRSGAPLATAYPLRIERDLTVLVRAIVFASAVAVALFAIDRQFGASETASRISLGLALEREGLVLAAVVITTAAMALIERESFLAYGLAPRGGLLKFALGCCWGIASISLLIGVLLWSHHLAIGVDRRGFGTSLLLALPWGLCFLGVGLAEEMLFRGYLQATLSRLIGFWPAVAVLSALFGLLHLRNPGELWFGIVTVALGGALFGLFLRRTGSLWLGIGFHTAWDWGQSFIFGAPDSGYLIQDHVFHSTPIGDALLSGGRAGPEGSVLVIPTMAVVLILTVNRRAKLALTQIWW